MELGFNIVDHPKKKKLYHHTWALTYYMLKVLELISENIEGKNCDGEYMVTMLTNTVNC